MDEKFVAVIERAGEEVEHYGFFDTALQAYDWANEKRREDDTITWFSTLEIKPINTI